uniref:Uncharacterized protein n=1 Tax=Astyanax mexicanus TaxID=7994 RepID=W5K794_ASTMX
MSKFKEQLQTRLQEYISETFEEIRTVKNFCDRVKQWIYQRKMDLERMRNIKERANTFLGRFRKQKLEEELGEVLNNTLEGLKILQPFLDAVEKLAVTSLHVFKEESVQLEGVSSSAVRSVIFTARFVSPLLIHFKRDSRAFFMPNLDNVEVLIFELEKYILLTQQIWEKMSLGPVGLVEQHNNSLGLYVSSIMLHTFGLFVNVTVCFLLMLSEFLCAEKQETFMEVQFPYDTEGPVVHYDVIDTAFETGKVIVHSGAVGKSIDTLVDGALAVKALSSEKVALCAVSLGLQKAKAARNIPNLAADLPDIGQLAAGTPLALSKAARAGFIGLNALFIGLGAFLICKESVSLAKGKKSEMSKLLRSRLSLWCTEILGWDEIFDCLWKGKDTFTENMNILYQPLNSGLKKKKYM